MRLSKIVPRKLIEKNPFLFRARSPEGAHQLVRRLINAFLSSSEETYFGEILESIARVICKEAKGGRKSGMHGIDLEYDENGVRTIMQIKSSVKWGNSSQHKKLISDFQSAVRILRQGTAMNIRCVEGCCYGPSGTNDRGTHLRVVGNAFWYDISGWKNAGHAILDIIGQHASNGLASEIQEAQKRIVDYLNLSGAAVNGSIQWHRLYDLIMMPTRERPR